VKQDYVRNSDATGQGFIDFGFIFELRMFRFDAFELDSNLLTGDDVDSEVDIT
jgi:hypothetical protein